MCSSCLAFILRKCTQSKWPEQACGPPPSMLQDLSTKKPTTQPEWSHSIIQIEKHMNILLMVTLEDHHNFLNLHFFTSKPAELPRKNGISKVLKSRQWIRQAMRLCTSLISWLETSCTRGTEPHELPQATWASHRSKEKSQKMQPKNETSFYIIYLSKISRHSLHSLSTCSTKEKKMLRKWYLMEVLQKVAWGYQVSTFLIISWILSSSYFG